MVLWLARAAGLGTSWKTLAEQGLITPREAAGIAANERVLQDLRIRLHYLAGRREDRLVFDHQIEMARQLKLKGKGAMVPSDLLMRRYYLAAKAIWRFNQILLSNLFARITPEAERRVRKLDEDFVVDNMTLEVRNEDLFEQKPGMILEAFRRLQDNRGLVGLGPKTLRALSRALPAINRAFRDDRANRRRFMEIVSSDRLTWTLRRMSRYGVLGRYIPAFGRIVGQMQHDLFHVYTVDEHILMVIRNLRRFRVPRFDHEYPFCSRLMQEFDRVEVLYLAALFHDIAKGRGGDHSHLGSSDATRFCRAHGMSRPDAELVAWLVEHHLAMSATAQKQDLSEPRGDLRLRNPGARRAHAHRALPPHGRRHPRHQPRGVERVEGQAPRGPLPPHAPRAARGDRLRAVLDRGQEGRGAAHLPPVRAAAGQRGRAVDEAGRQLLPALRGERDRLARAHTLGARNARQADRARAPLARRRGPAGAGLRARPARPLRAHHQLLRAYAVGRGRRQDLHDHARLRARRLPGAVALARRGRPLPRPDPEGRGGARRAHRPGRGARPHAIRARVALGAPFPHRAAVSIVPRDASPGSGSPM